MKPPPPPVFAHPATATETQPWENSLGMKFVPVPGTKVLFSIWETRRRDYEFFRNEDLGSISPWYEDHLKRRQASEERITTLAEGGSIVQTGTWENPGWPVSPNHPATGLHIRNAQFFCTWLTLRERAAGRLPPGWHYRLPTSAEWLTAAGGENATPRPGNVAGIEVRKDSRWPAERPTFDTNDGFLHIAPVGSFPQELHGLYDISGNVTEWVLDEDEPTYLRPGNSKAQLRGPSCVDGTPALTAFGYVRAPLRAFRIGHFGFRVVLAVDEAE
jgi:formylglycine-generating enzyme required for sulfatase activity